MAINDFLPVSPVPSDENLYPGELPFTAFGQWGEGQLDLRVFDQDIYWVNVTGEPFLLTEMTKDYLQNVLAFLFNSVESFYLGIVIKKSIETIYDAYHKDNLEQLDDPSKLTVCDQNPVEWLAATVLVKKINTLLED